MRKQCRYVLVGQGKPSRFLRLAKKLGLAGQVQVLDGRDDIPRFFAGADLMLHPAYQESAGYTLLEAVIAGLPVLTTASCGYAFHIEQAQAGEVCAEPFSQDELNQRLLSMLNKLDQADWSDNGLAYGKNPELYALGETATDLLESFVTESSFAMSNVTLGLAGALGHDPAAALIVDGKLVAAVEEERLIRRKHAVNELPYRSAPAVFTDCQAAP
jgi:glycogen synthase